MIRKFISRVRRRLFSGLLMPSAKGMTKVAPYRVVPGHDLEDFFAQVRAMCEPLANPFCYYEALIEELSTIPSLRLVPVVEFAASRPAGESLVCLRHDVDADPITALRIARYLASVGVSGSFYLLHTSPYYAAPCEGVIVRNPELAKWIRGLIVAGCEVGLHNDALTVQAKWGMDGVAAIRDELAWLRSQGLNIRGSVAHNSGPVYGAENYEIFAGRVLWKRKVKSGSGIAFPLGSVQEKELGLEYEGTFAVPKNDPDTHAAAAFFADLGAADCRSEEWMRKYLVDNPACDWAVDIQCWLLGKDMWVVAGKYDGTKVFEWNIGLEKLLQMLRAMPLGLRIMMVVHPEYVSG